VTSTCDDAFDWAARDPGRPIFCVRDGGAWQPVTAKEFAGRVASVAAGLVGAGIRAGDRVVLMSPTSLDWVVCDFAIWAAGAVTVPVYETSSAEQVRWILGDSGAVAAFAGNARCAQTIRQAQPAKVEALWQIDAGGLDALAQLGGTVTAEALTRRRLAVAAGDLATIVYTSGTTGRPKGCMISHGNLAAAVAAITGAPGIQDRVLTPDAASLFFLPLSHILARVVTLCLVRSGTRVGFLPDASALPARLVAFRPTFLLGVPRMFEKLIAQARARAEDEGHQKLFAAAEATAITWSQTRADGSRGGTTPRGRAGPVLRLRHAIYDRLVYARLRAALGGRLAWTICGGAPLSPDLAHFLRGAGLPILEGWGLTETTGPITMNPPAGQRIGSVGLPLPGCGVRVAADGEIEVTGPNVSQGYWHDPHATAEAFHDGWLRTGDLGRLDSDGYLYLTGRKKDLIITAGGKNVVPAVLEDRLREHWLIEDCIVVGDRRPYIAALITLDTGAFARWKQRQGKPAAATPADLRADPDLRAVIGEAVDRANTAVSRAEAIKRFRVLSDEFAVGAELTDSLKVRREYVLAKFADEITALYG
jgi:long-chain acyl-CoA synthetase